MEGTSRATRLPWRARKTISRKMRVDLPEPGRPIMWVVLSRASASVGARFRPLGVRTEKTARPSVDRRRVSQLRGKRAVSAASSVSRSCATASSSAIVTRIGFRTTRSGAGIGRGGRTEISRVSQMTSEPLSPETRKRKERFGSPVAMPPEACWSGRRRASRMAVRRGSLRLTRSRIEKSVAGSMLISKGGSE